MGVCVWGGDTRPIVTQKYTFHLEALTDRFAPMRPRHARADDQCWICLDGDTEGREVRPSSRLVVARRDDAPNATRRARTEIIITEPIAHRSKTRERANGTYLSIDTHSNCDWTKSGVKYGVEKVFFVGNISREIWVCYT